MASTDSTVTSPCPKCSAPRDPYDAPCAICAAIARLKERIRFRQRRHRVPGARWAGQQMQKAAYETPENNSAMPPSDR